jgi:hypothetical protein
MIVNWILIVTGVLTATTIYAAIAPRPGLRLLFGETLEGPLAEVIVRNWAALITMVGAVLIYAGATATLTVPALVFAGVCKLIFIALVTSQGRRFMSRLAGAAVIFDVICVVLYAAILLAISA